MRIKLGFGLLLSAVLLCASVSIVSQTADAADGDVASVGDQTFQNFTDAVEYALGGDVKTIVMQASVDLTDLGVVDVDGLTIDLNGHTISADNFSLIFQGTGFSIINGYLDSKGGSYALFVGDEGTTDDVIIRDVTLNGGINVFNATNVVLDGISFTGTDYYAVWCDQNAHVTILDGLYRSYGNAVIGMSLTETDLNILGGTFTAADGQPLVLQGNYNTPVITGGTFNVDVSDYLPEGYRQVGGIVGPLSASSISSGSTSVTAESDTTTVTIHSDGDVSGVTVSATVDASKTSEADRVSLTYSGSVSSEGLALSATQVSVAAAGEDVSQDDLVAIYDISVSRGSASGGFSLSVSFQIPVPEGMRVQNAWVIYYGDDGETETFRADVSGGTVTFTTTHTSTYAAYATYTSDSALPPWVMDDDEDSGIAIGQGSTSSGSDDSTTVVACAAAAVVAALMAAFLIIDRKN